VRYPPRMYRSTAASGIPLVGVAAGCNVLPNPLFPHERAGAPHSASPVGSGAAAASAQAVASPRHRGPNRRQLPAIGRPPSGASCWVLLGLSSSPYPLSSCLQYAPRQTIPNLGVISSVGCRNVSEDASGSIDSDAHRTEVSRRYRLKIILDALECGVKLASCQCV